MPEELDLTPEDEAILAQVWAERVKASQLEEQGIGPPRWGMDRARHERPAMAPADLEVWVRVANDEHRRLRMAKVAGSEADRLSLQAANARFPLG